MFKKIALTMCLFTALCMFSCAKSNGYLGVSDIEHAMIVSEDKLFLAGAKKMYFFDLSDMQLIKAIKKPKGRIDSSLCYDKFCLWSGGYTAFANLGRFLNSSEQYTELERKLDLDIGRMYAMFFDKLNDLIIGIHSTGRVSVFSAKTLDFVHSFYISKSELFAGIMDRQDHYLFAGDGSGQVISIDIKTQKTLAESVALGGAVIALYDYDDEYVLVSSTDRQLTLFDKATLSKKNVLLKTESVVMTFYRSGVDGVLYCGLADGQVLAISPAGQIEQVVKLKDKVILIDSVKNNLLILSESGELRKMNL